MSLLTFRSRNLTDRVYQSKPGRYFHIASNLSKGEFYNARKHPTFPLLGKRLIDTLENIYPDFLYELNSMGKVAPPSEIFVCTHGFPCSSGFLSNGTLLLNEADTNVTWAGVYLLHSMEDLGPVDPRNVPTLFQLIAHPGLLGTAARLFQDRYGYSAQDREPWASNQPRPEKVSDPFVASANKEFLNLACACLLRAFGFRSLDKYFRNQNEAIVFAADAYMVDRLLAVESGIFPDSALRTVALEFALLFARGFIWADPGEYPSGQQRVLRIVERIEKQGITIPENDPFWRTLCLGAALWSDHFDWNHAARSNRELFEAFAVTEVRE